MLHSQCMVHMLQRDGALPSGGMGMDAPAPAPAPSDDLEGEDRFPDWADDEFDDLPDGD